MRIGYAGAEGAFAHQACLAFAPRCQPVPLPDFGAVVASVLSGDTERGMLPLRNSRAGAVSEVADLLSDTSVKRSPPHMLPVRMHLLGLPGASLADLRVVTSHPMALRQCARSLARLNVETAAAPNTALAARALRDRTVGVLASGAAASAYGLQILQADMQDDPDNNTTFIIIERSDD
jgi:prephenate dehydratase